MSRIPEDNFAALQQNWMVVSRVRGEASFHRQRSKCRADVIEPGAFDQSKAGVSGRQPAEQRDKSRTKKQQTCSRAFRERPLPNDVAPQERQNQKITPYHELQIVPIPRRRLDKIAESENHDRGEHERDIRRGLVAPTPFALPNTPGAQSNKPQRQRYPQTEVWQPKLQKRRDYAVPCFLQQQTKTRGRSKILRPELEIGRSQFGRILRPTGMPFEHRCRVKLVRSQPNKKRCGDECRDQDRGGVSANRRASENLGPHLWMRNQATDAGNSFVANEVADEIEFGCAFEKQSNDQHDCQRNERMQV